MTDIDPEISVGKIDWPQAGQIWDTRFEILSLIGEGAAGRVYKAKHLAMDQIVALKILNPALIGVDKSTAQRFQNEAALLSSMRHPNIVRFLSFGCTPNMQLYMVLELIEGISLAGAIKAESTIPAARAILIFKDIARALTYAHQLSVIHRDLKPQNVMLVHGESLDAKIIDFGILKSVANNELGLTKTGQILGSSFIRLECREMTLKLHIDCKVCVWLNSAEWTKQKGHFSTDEIRQIQVLRAA